MALTLIQNELKNLESEYKAFMGIDSFPEYTIHTKEISLEETERQGFVSAAEAFYSIDNRVHSLTIATNISIPEYIIFHEFTHIFDSDRYVNGDKNRYVGLSGYTEYHAAQIELLKLLGSPDCRNCSQFSMSRKITTISGEITVQEYIDGKQALALEIFNKSDFTSSLKVLSSGIGVLFNYWGLRSICNMYSTDYEEKMQNEIFQKYIPPQVFNPLDQIMTGWLSKVLINISINGYNSAIYPLITKNNLS